MGLFDGKRCEKALLRAARGETEALSELYDLLSRQIYTLAYGVLRDHHAAEDVLQETFVEIVSSAARYQKGTHARAWILGIARHRALKAYHVRQKEIPVETEFSPEREALPPEEKLALTEALEKLDERSVRVVCLKTGAGLRFREIAEILEISTASAEKIYQRALKSLRVYYGKEKK